MWLKKQRRSIPASAIPSLALGGGSSPAQLSYPVIIAQQWSALFNGLDPGTDGNTQAYDFGSLDVTNNLVDALQTALDMGSPFADVEAADPTEVIENINTAREAYDTALESFTDPSATIDTYMSSAATTVADHVISGTLVASQIALAVGAFRDRREEGLNRLLASVMAGYAEANAVVGTQMGQRLVAEVRGFEDTVAEFDARLTSTLELERPRYVIQVAEQALRAFELRYKLLTQAVSIAAEAGRFEITATQDQKDKDLGYEVKNIQWELDLYDYPFKGMAALGGAAVLPRAQTQGERLLGSVTNALSAGLSVGTTFGSPAIGAAAGLGMLGADLLGSQLDKR